MDFDLDAILDNYDEDEAAANLERKLQEDEQPVSRDGDDDCGDGCKI